MKVSIMSLRIRQPPDSNWSLHCCICGPFLDVFHLVLHSKSSYSHAPALINMAFLLAIMANPTGSLTYFLYRPMLTARSTEEPCQSQQQNDTGTQSASMVSFPLLLVERQWSHVLKISPPALPPIIVAQVQDNIPNKRTA
eukprot:s2249_g10.t1